MARLGGTDFQADMTLFAAKVQNIMREIPIEASKGLIEDVRVPVSSGGNMPVKYGNLRNSITVDFATMPPASAEYPPALVEADPTARNNARLDNSRPGARIFIGFRAIYAPLMELKYAFVRLASQKWASVHVPNAVNIVRNRYR